MVLARNHIARMHLRRACQRRWQSGVPSDEAAASVLRPQVVSDYQSGRVAAERFKWRLFGAGTWALTLGAGALVALSNFEGLPGSGEHALSPLQRAAAAVLGSAPVLPPPTTTPPPHTLR